MMRLALPVLAAAAVGFALAVAPDVGAGDEDPLRQAEKDLRSPSSVTRVGACRRLGKLADRRAVPLLLAALRDDTVAVRVEAVDALAVVGDEVAVPQLSRLLADGSPTVRGRALLALGKLADKYAAPTVAARLTDADAGVRVCAVRALGELGDPLVADAIRRLLDHTEEDPDDVLLSTAIVALTQLEGRKALDDLFARAGDADAFGSWLVRSSLLWAVAEGGDRDRLPFVRRGFAADDDRVAGAAATALVRLGVPAPVVAALEDGDPVRRRIAVAALAESGEARWKERLLAKADDPVVRVRLEAAIGLSRMGAPEAFPSLVEGLGSPTSWIWTACANELRRAYGRDFGRDRDAWTAWFRKERERLHWDAASRTWSVR